MLVIIVNYPAEFENFDEVIAMIRKTLEKQVTVINKNGEVSIKNCNSDDIQKLYAVGIDLQICQIINRRL